MIVLSEFVDYFMKIKASKHSIPVGLEPPKIFVHGKFNDNFKTSVYSNLWFLGGGGVGKSFLINLVKMWAEYILRKPGDHPLKPKVLLLGPTGMAANLIGKYFEMNWSELF